MNDTLKLIETRTINDALVNGYYGKKEAWFTRDEIGSVLGYADPRQSIANIHNRHKERFSDKSVQINLICTDGKSYDTTVYNFKGVMEICRWSKQPKADMVMEALYDMAESVARTGSIPYFRSGAYRPSCEASEREPDISQRSRR